MHSYVLAEMTDGAAFDGILTGLDNENVYFAVPKDIHQHEAYPYRSSRPFGYAGYGGPFGYTGYPTYPRPRFSRLVLPLTALAAISLLPWY